MKDNNTMEAGQTRYVYRGKRFNVRLLDVLLPNGRSSHKEVVEHPGAVVILPLLDGNVVLLRQFRASVDSWLYELPAGTLDRSGESVELCARRELREETGYVADSFKELFRMYPSPGFCTEVIYSFLTENLKKDRASPEAGEVIEPIVLSFDEALELVKNQRIVDAKTLLTLLFYERYVKEC